MSAENARVRVLVRSRPLPDGSTGAPSLKSDPSQPGIVVIRAPAPDGVGESTEREFLLDDVIMGDTRHEDVFERGCREHVDHVMEGFNACVFAYGQTGSGKTYVFPVLRPPPRPTDSLPQQGRMVLCSPHPRAQRWHVHPPVPRSSSAA